MKAVVVLPGPSHAQAGVGRRVLVVDDNRDACDSLALLLRLSGHSTHVAYSGAQALALAADCAPYLVFLDIGMPGMDGYAVAKALRGDPRTRHAVLVALTGWGADDDLARTRASGFDHHLTKPADPRALNAVLRAADCGLVLPAARAVAGRVCAWAPG